MPQFVLLRTDASSDWTIFNMTYTWIKNYLAERRESYIFDHPLQVEDFHDFACVLRMMYAGPLVSLEFKGSIIIITMIVIGIITIIITLIIIMSIIITTII